MKKLLVLILFISITFFSFQKNRNVPQQTQTNLKHIQVKIIGMTCEIGCARIIESKISKLSGVKFSKVDFAKSIGQFSFDPKITSTEKIITKINGIGGGNLYKVIDYKEVKKF